MYYKTCPDCGCNLDPGEPCDCKQTKKETAPLSRERPLSKVPTHSLSAQKPCVNVERMVARG